MSLCDSYEHLKVTRDGPILTVSLNNPPMNPISGARHKELSTIFADVNRDDQTKVVILTAPGETFSAGGDVKAIATRLENKDFETWPITMLEGGQRRHHPQVGHLHRRRQPVLHRRRVRGEDAMGRGDRPAWA
jgi:enoyl-CoA hydratase/carnithine racemase